MAFAAAPGLTVGGPSRVARCATGERPVYSRGRMATKQMVSISGPLPNEEMEGLVESFKGVVPGTSRLQREHEFWAWKGQRVNFKVSGPENAPINLLLTHGFGASVNHWYELQDLLSEAGLRVYSVDLLGFGASDKPVDFDYNIELWSSMLKDFVSEKGGQWILCGNSIGSLISLDATRQLGKDIVAGMCLFNCPGGMTVFRYKELPFPLRAIYFLMRKALFNPLVGRYIFSSFRSKENIKSILQQVYGNREKVTDELVEMLFMPSEDKNAVDVFLKVLDGPAGPEPESILREVQWCPALSIWGAKDPWTPLNKNNGVNFHPGDQFADYHPKLELIELPDTGHCPHDEHPAACAEEVLSWISRRSIIPRKN